MAELGDASFEESNAPKRIRIASVLQPSALEKHTARSLVALRNGHLEQHDFVGTGGAQGFPRNIYSKAAIRISKARI